MISKKMKQQVEGSSVIRAMFEEGKRLAAIYGKDNVFDFSIGNPSVNPPEIINETLKELIIPDSVVSLEDNCFKYCLNIRAVQRPR